MAIYIPDQFDIEVSTKDGGKYNVCGFLTVEEAEKHVQELKKKYPEDTFLIVKVVILPVHIKTREERTPVKLISKND